MIRRVFKIILVLVAIIIIVPILAVSALMVGLNTATGRNFAVQQINKFGAGQIAITGLAGHFPADIKLASINVIDTKSVWLTGQNLELRWNPRALFSRNIHVTSLTATTVTVTRTPIAAPQKPQKTTPTKLPKFHLNVDHFVVPSLNIGAALAGQNLLLNVAGATHLQSPTQGDATLTAIAANGQGSYKLAAAINNQTIDTVLDVAEPPDGLLGHFAGPQVHDPLTLHLTLIGPRDAAALNFAAALGAAKLNGAGTLGLNPNAPKADVVFTIPALAPFAAIGKQNVAGNTKLHFLASQHNNATDLALNGDVALTQGPGPAAKLVGPNGHLALLVSLANNTVTIKNLKVTGAGFAVAASGTVAQAGVNLQTQLQLDNVSTLSPGISGGIAETGTVAGSAKDFAVHAVLTGNISEKSLPTGPFTITIHAAHLPQAPAGKITGTGALENSPLVLDADFARNAAGAATLVINKALWRSLDAQANLALAPPEKLPTGTAKFAVKRLADFSAFAPLPLAGSITGDFAHQSAQNFVLNLNAAQLVVSPSIGAIDAKLSAAGPLNALAVKLTAVVAKLMAVPARIATQAVLNLDNRSASISAFTANWHGLNAVLQGPATVETKPNMAIRHLELGLNGGQVTLDGTISPKLNARLAVKNLQLSQASLFAPSLNATGIIAAGANVSGTTATPQGSFSFTASGVKLHSGPAAALPAADLNLTGTLAGKTANMLALLKLGSYAHLNADGLVPLNATGPISLHLAGTTDLRLIDPILAANGTSLRGVITPDFTVTGTPQTPAINGAMNLADGSVQNIGSGLSLTKIAARIIAAGKLITLQSLTATAGQGTISGHGSVDLSQPAIPIDLAINADHATPVSSDLVTETIDAALTIKGAVHGPTALAGTVNIDKANINIPKSLPPSVANLPILNRGEKPPPPPPPAPPISLALIVRAANQIFIRGDGLFAELGGKLTLGGTAANPIPDGGFTLIRGYFALGGHNLQFTKGVVSFNGNGFIPTLDLEASTTTGSTTATLVIGGTAAAPTITLTSSPPLPSDEVLAHLLFGQGTQNLSAFQAASLAAALAQLAGVGGGADPLGAVRNALGLDELSMGGGQNGGAPSLQAGRYVAPGVYVGAQQSTSGSGTQATVQINLYKGLKLNSSTGTSSTSSGNSSSVGLTYQFNY